MSEEVKPVECDCCGGAWGYINADGEHDNVYECVTTLTQQRDEARRELTDLRTQLAAAKEELQQALDMNGGDNGTNASWTYAAMYQKEYLRANIAERERDEARREREEWETNSATIINGMAAEADGLRHRAERMGQVCEALANSLRVAVESDLGALWVWPSTARETWCNNAREALESLDDASAGES